jgi:hypothetical protein
MEGKRVFTHQYIPVALVLAIEPNFPATYQPLLKKPGNILEKRPFGLFSYFIPHHT